MPVGLVAPRRAIFQIPYGVAQQILQPVIFKN